jgi:hypothetical protein
MDVFVFDVAPLKTLKTPDARDLSLVGGSGSNRTVRRDVLPFAPEGPSRDNPLL